MQSRAVELISTMDNKHYENAEKQSFKDYSTSELRIQYDEPSEWLAHKTGFRDGYKFGLSQLQPSNELTNQRLQVAAMIVQGLLAGGMKKGVVARAIELTDSLLTEINKNNET